MSGIEQIGNEAMALADHLVQEYGENITVGTVMVLVDVSVEAPDGVYNPITYSCSDSRRWIQVALLNEALERAEADNEAREFQAHEDDD